MRTVRNIPYFENIPILVRTALNVPVENGEVVSDYRLRRALPTIKFLSDRGARVILISHIGEQGTETLEPVARALGKLITRVSQATYSYSRTYGDSAENDITILPLQKNLPTLLTSSFKTLSTPVTESTPL